MGSKSQPQAPAAPDPTTVANAQAAANTASAQEQQKLNQLGSSGPTGSVKWQADPSQPGGYTQVTTLSPGQQSIYDQGVAAQSGALNIANQQLGRVGDVLGQSTDPHSYGSLSYGASTPPVQTGYDPSGQQQTSVAPSGSIQGSYGAGGSIQTGVQPYGSIQNNVAPTQTGITSSYASGGPVQYGYSQGGQIQQQVGNPNVNQSVQNASNSAYAQAASRLDPQWSQSQEQLQSQLAAQGLNSNDAAYQTAMTNFNNSKTDAYNQANYSAIAAGDTEQNTLYQQQLASGQFANQAQLQQNTENAGQAQFYNAAQNQANTQNAAAAAFQNAAQGQEYNQNLQSMQAANAAQAQGYGQNATGMQLANAAQAQQNSQNASAAAFGNSAQAQQYGQNLSSGEFYNQGQQTQYGENQGNAQFYNTAQNQEYNQGLQNAGLNNAAQSQAFQQGTYAQQLPLNEFNALMSSGQVSMPSSAVYTPTSVGQTDVTGAYALQQKAQQAAYQAQLQQQSGMMGGLFSLGSAAIMASDARLKRDVRPAFRDRAGRLWRWFRYAWERADAPLRLGVMAQEMLRSDPRAVIRHPAGFLQVNYAALRDDEPAEVFA